MINRGMTVVANEDHFDDHFGDIYIERGDQFKVIDLTMNQVTLQPVDERKYLGESQVISHPDFFKELAQ